MVGDPPDAWRAAGFAVTDGVVRIGAVAVRLADPGEGRGIRGWSFTDLPGEPTDLDGLPLVPPVASSDGPAAAAADHPNGALQIDHVVVLTPDLDRTLGAFDAVGLAARAVRESDTYGLPMRQAFLRSGEVVLEVVGPIEPSGDDGPVTFFGLAHTVADLDATAAQLGGALGRTKDAVQPGRRIATLRHRDVGMSVATAFMSPDPRSGSAGVR